MGVLAGLTAVLPSLPAFAAQNTAAASQSVSPSLQAAFAAAALEFGGPEGVLLAVSTRRVQRDSLSDFPPVRPETVPAKACSAGALFPPFSCSPEARCL
ncbi:uncharacterized protein STAUR_0385 [Stigmatella aurantiaca DW4/3-1]|uniref:Uncharacterized protein n=1 Tax=Stigmatella aurantiaca (strain DW4/3-1) TaxID=378806 RepID=E3FQ84_STIAD|nr:uncharacterized protein STAUR_0385 [Stigmatella aurantiaca DW4/3-1]